MMVSLTAPVDEIRLDRPRLRVESILRFQRYRSIDQVAPAILEVARDMTALAESLVEPRAVFTTREVQELGSDGVTLQGGVTFHSQVLARHLAGAHEVVCAVATVGARFDEQLDAMSRRGEMLEWLFLDSAGWLAVEDTLRMFRGHLRAWARRRDLHPTPRLGPGYLDWSLWEQANLFSLFQGFAMPVALSEHCVMTPRKSLSALFGLVRQDGAAPGG